MPALCVLIGAGGLAGSDKRFEPMTRPAADRWDTDSERLSMAPWMRSIWRRIAVVTDMATLALWRDQAKLVRGKMTEFWRVSVMRCR